MTKQTIQDAVNQFLKRGGTITIVKSHRAFHAQRPQKMYLKPNHNSMLRVRAASAHYLGYTQVNYAALEQRSRLACAMNPVSAKI